jgi:RNA polymerase sigma-70 factor (ECF subfamily)
MYELSPTMGSFGAGCLAVKETLAITTVEAKPVPKAEPDSDEILLIAVGNSQDTAAFNQLFSRFAKKIFAMGMKLTRNEQLAQDLVQEAMLMVWQKAPLYDFDRGNAQSWIFTLTRNRCFDMLRKIKRQPSCISADDIWPTDGEADSVFVHEEQGTLQVEIAQIERFYSDLPESQQAVVEQIFILDRTHEEAARALQIPLGTLKSRLRLGVGKLRQLIGITS